ncbi:hypothetical protein SASPL_116423 [Salvia splendens]|uniref:Uncharacterized protein n=1 Tax=Salvia splendens TaxID=180675 RepID=A0A8X8XYP6_SALSN|nr:hypothetical protein SASPL_116423 [Salvia splendens]
MERECMRKKRESLEERRSPLQNLNGLPIHRRNTKNISPISSSSAPAASRSSLSVNNTSSSTPFSHSSKTHFHNKQNPLPKAAKFKPNVPTSRKPFLQTSRKDLDAKPTCKNRQRSKLSPVHGKSEKGSQEFQKKMKISGNYRVSNSDGGSSSNCAELCTPHSLNLCDHESAVDDLVYEGGEAANDVKTHLLSEASLSPEIQCQSQSRMVVLKSVGTPVLYGAGHLVSGKGDHFSDENASGDLQVPLLAEASVRWHLSPCDLRNSYSGNGSVRNVEIDRSNVAAVLTKNLECNMDESLACLNSGNMIQTPDSDSSSGMRFGRSRFEVNLSNSFWPDSITELLEGVKLSPRNEVSMWGDEEIDGDKACTVVGSVEHEDDGFRIGNELSPVILDYEPCLPAEGKGKSFSTGSNA